MLHHLTEAEEGKKAKRQSLSVAKRSPNAEPIGCFQHANTGSKEMGAAEKGDGIGEIPQYPNGILGPKDSQR